MKRVAILVPAFPVPSETFVVTEIRALQEAGHHVSVFTLEPPEGNSETLNDLDVYHFSDADFLDHCRLCADHITLGWQVAQSMKAISSVSLMKVGCQLAGLFKRLKIDHLHCHFMHNSLAYGLVASKIASTNISGIGHGHDIYVNRADLAAKLALCDFSIAVCEDMLSLFNALGANNSRLLHCGVDTSHFVPRPYKKHGHKRLLFVGRLVEKKGLDTAIIALSNIPTEQRPSLDIVGSGPLYQTLEQLTKQLGLKRWVHFLGYKKPSQIIEMGCHYDAFIAPFCQAENGDRDTGPVVLKEAMAMGLPVITTDLMGCKEIVNPDVGYVVPSKDTGALRLAIERFCSLTEQGLMAMRLAARKRVEQKFNSHAQAIQLSNWIEQVQHE